MKLHQSLVLQNLDLFRCNPGANHDLMRDHEGMFIMWKCIEYFRPRSILEIGFGCGQTLGLMIEAAGDACDRVVSVDLKHDLANFKQIFPDRKIRFLGMDSKNLDLQEQFDFIMIDGDHRYDGVSTDIRTCLPLLHKDSILCIDDYWFEDVDRAIKDYLLDSLFVPFLSTEQQIYFHHQEHSVEDLLDRWLIENGMHFVTCTQKQYHDISIAHAKFHNIMFIKDYDIFRLGLKFFDQ